MLSRLAFRVDENPLTAGSPASHGRILLFRQNPERRKVQHGNHNKHMVTRGGRSRRRRRRNRLGSRHTGDRFRRQLEFELVEQLQFQLVEQLQFELVKQLAVLAVYRRPLTACGCYSTRDLSSNSSAAQRITV